MGISADVGTVFQRGESVDNDAFLLPTEFSDCSFEKFLSKLFEHVENTLNGVVDDLNDPENTPGFEIRESDSGFKFELFYYVYNDDGDSTGLESMASIKLSRISPETLKLHWEVDGEITNVLLQNHKSSRTDIYRCVNECLAEVSGLSGDLQQFFNAGHELDYSQNLNQAAIWEPPEDSPS